VKNEREKYMKILIDYITTIDAFSTISKQILTECAERVRSN